MECMQFSAGGTQFVSFREVVGYSECPLSEVPLYLLQHSARVFTEEEKTKVLRAHKPFLW